MTADKPKFRIYQDNNAPPGWGVQAIVFEHPDVGWAIASHGDFYVQKGDQWYAMDLIGMIDHVVNELGAVKAGRFIAKDEFDEIYKKAMEDRDFAQKNGHLPREPK